MILRQITLKLVCKPWAQGDLLRGPLDLVLHGTAGAHHPTPGGQGGKTGVRRKFSAQ